MSGWKAVSGLGKALYPFKGKENNQLSLNVGDVVVITQEAAGWYRGYLQADPGPLKIFPAAYVQFTPKDDDIPPPPEPENLSFESIKAAAIAANNDVKQQEAREAAANLLAAAKEAEAREAEAREILAKENAIKEAAAKEQAEKDAVAKEIADKEAAIQAAIAKEAADKEAAEKEAAAKEAAAKEAELASKENIPTLDLTVSTSTNEKTVASSPSASSTGMNFSSFPASPTATVASPRSATMFSSTSKVIAKDSGMSKLDNQNIWLPVVDADTRESSVMDGFFSLGIRGDTNVTPATISNKNAVELVDGYRILEPTIGVNTSSISQDSVFKRIMVAQEKVAKDQEDIGAVGVFSGSEGIYLESDGSEASRKLHLFLDVKVCIFAVAEATELLFSLFSLRKNCFISEEFVINLPPPGHQDHTKILGKMKTIFRDLDPADFQSEIYLVCRIFRKGALLYDPKEAAKFAKEATASDLTRRCFGCAMTSITAANLTLPANIGVEYEPAPASFAIYTPTVETNFCRIHELMLSSNSRDRDLEPAPRAKGIALGITVFEGELPALRTAHRAKLNGVCETQKLAFPRVWDPAVERNDLYLTLLDGSFSQDKKTAARNVEVRVRLLRNDYSPLDSIFFRGSGEDALSEYRSGVYYHSNTPVYNESIKICVTPDTLSNCHLYFEFWHVSTNVKKSAPFSCAFFPLGGSTAASLFNTTHNVATYRPFVKGEQYLHDSVKIASPANSRKEFFRFSLALNSTALSQNNTMTKIAEWKTVDRPFLQSSLMSYLLKSSVSNTDEVARFMRMILDALFGVLSSQTHQDTHLYAFNAIAHTFARLSSNYHKVLIMYINNCFSETSAYSRLIPLLTQAITQQIDSYSGMLSTLAIPSQSSPVGPFEEMPSPRGRTSLLCGPTANASSFQVSNNNLYAQSNGTSTPSISSSASGLGLGISSSASFGATGGFNGTSPSSTVMRPNATPARISTSSFMNDTPHGSTPGTPVSSSAGFPGSPSTIRLTQPSKMVSFNEDDEDVAVSDIPEVIRLARSAFFLVSITIKSYLESEKVTRPAVSATATPAGFRALPPISTSSAVPAPISASSRADFKVHIQAIMSEIARFVALPTYDVKDNDTRDAKAIRLLSQAQIILIQGFTSCIVWMNQVFDAEDVAEIVRQFISSIPPASMTSMYKLGLMRAMLTGTESTPSVLLFDKTLAETQLSARYVNTICSAPRVLEGSTKALAKCPSPVLFDKIVPVIAKATAECLALGVANRSVSEAYSATTLLQLLYTRIANSSIYSTTEDSSLYTNLTVRELFPVLPALISTVHMLQVACPDSTLSPTQISQQKSSFEEISGLGSFGLQPPSAYELRSSYVDPLVDSVNILIAIIHAVSDEDIFNFLSALPRAELDCTASKLLFICSSSIDRPIFPPRWIYVHAFALSVIVRILKILQQVLRQHFYGDNFSSTLWVSWLQLALSIRQTEYLDVDRMHSSRSGFVVEHFSDCRAGVFELFESMWNDLSDHQRVGTSSLLVEKLLLLMSTSSGAFVKVAMNVYYDLLCAQYRIASDFSEVERYSIDALYEIANTSTNASKCMSTLQSSLTERFNAESDPSMTAAGLEFLDHVTTMFSLMASLLQFPNGPEYEDDRTSVALRLINYIERTGHSASTRKAMHTRYVQYLVNLHTEAGNHVECAITRLQQAKVLDWANTNLEAFDKFPSEPERVRKERLIRAAIEYFVKGEDWERAIDRLDYLRHYYQHIIYDYRSLSHTLAQQAEYFSKAQASSRFYFKYFRVCFFGKYDDPSLAQQCEFVYKGVKLENIMEFTGRIRKRYPNANFVMSPDRPSEDVLAKYDQTICIAILNIPDASTRAQIASKCAASTSAACSALKASSTNKHEFFEQFSSCSTSLVVASNSTHPSLVPMPPHVARHLDNDAVRVFEYSKPWRRTLEKNPANEFKDLWLIRTFCVTSEAFPSNRRRIPTISKTEVILTPIMHAIESIQKKTADLSKIAASVANVPFGSPADCGPLSMTLQGIVDAAVNGGTNKYIEAFLNDEFLDPSTLVHDDEREDVSKTIAQRTAHQEEMKAALRDQIVVVREALEIFGQKRDLTLKGLQDHITQSLMVMIQQNGPLIKFVN